MYRTILVPLDGSTLAETALPHAQLLASVTGARLDLMRVTVPRFVQLPNGGHVVEENADEEEAEAYLKARLVELADMGIRADGHVSSGNVAEEVTQRAIALGTDLIVMSTHGRTGTRLYAYGSVAYEVLRTAPCSVLVVRGEKRTE